MNAKVSYGGVPFWRVPTCKQCLGLKHEMIKYRVSYVSWGRLMKKNTFKEFAKNICKYILYEQSWKVTLRLNCGSRWIIDWYKCMTELIAWSHRGELGGIMQIQRTCSCSTEPSGTHRPTTQHSRHKEKGLDHPRQQLQQSCVMW